MSMKNFEEMKISHQAAPSPFYCLHFCHNISIFGATSVSQEK